MHAMVTVAACIALLPTVCALTVAPGRPEKAALFLQAEARRLDSTELSQLGDEVRQPGELDKVKEMITHMIAKHEAAQSEDTSHKAFCDKEMAASKAKVEKLKGELEKRNADQDLHSAQMAELKDSISDLHEGIANAHKDRKKAADISSKGEADYKQNVAEWDKTLLAARRQLTSDIPSVRKTAQQLNEDLNLKKVKAENAEQDAQFRFKKMDDEFAVELARKTKEVELKERTVVSKTHDLSLGDGDFKMAQEEMAAAKDYAEKIKSSCVVRQDPAKERKRAREEQMSSLKEAYGILSGNDIPR
jgi:hypothetical protein